MSQTRSQRSLCALLLLSCASVAQASEGLGWLFEADLEYGGDDIVTVNFTDGSDQDIKAGQGITLALGGHYRWPGSPFGMRGTVGYKYVTTAASNADISIGRMVYEVLGSYSFENDWWFAAGLTHHSGIQFNGDGFGPDVDFDDATAPTLELGWRWIALSYTKIDYTDEFDFEWDASSFGLSLRSRF